MGRTFEELAREKFADAINLHGLDVAFYDPTSRWVRLVLANEFRAIVIDFEPPDGYMDLRFGSIPRRRPGSQIDWALTRGFRSLRKILSDQGMHAHLGEGLWKLEDIEGALESFAREVLKRDSLIFGTGVPPGKDPG